MPLLIWIVMIEPGTVCPLGDVPTTAPYDALLLTGVAWSATWKPASLSRWRAGVLVHAGHAGHPRTGRAVDVARIGRAAAARRRSCWRSASSR